MLEHCEICMAEAPAWENAEYAEWHLGVDRDGSYLGVVCAGCFAGEEMAFICIAGEEALVLEFVSTRRRPAGHPDDGLARAA